MRYRAVLFDLDDTLIPEAPAIQAGFDAVAARVWGAVTAARSAALREAAYAAWAQHAPAQEYLAGVHVDAADGLHGALAGQGEEAAAVRSFVPAFHELAFEAALPARAAGTSRELAGVWREARIAHLTAYPETRAVLESLRADRRLGLVTNGPSNLQRLKVRQTGLADYFSVVVAAEDVGVGKPGAPIFAAAMRELDLGPGEVVMVGNDLGRDIVGARAAGIDAIWVDRERVDPAADGLTDLGELRDRLA